MNDMAWMRRLSKPGRVLARMPGGHGYGVFLGQDRRRRPSARLSEAEVRKAVSEGWLLSSPSGGYTLSSEARSRLVSRSSDEDQAFADQHRDMQTRSIMDEDGRMRRVQVNRNQSPIYRYLKTGKGSGLIDEIQFAAGERLRDDFSFAAMGRPVSSDWSMIARDKSTRSSQDPAASSDARIDARQRVMKALEAVGQGLDHLLIQVCLRECGMRSAETALSWPERSGGPALRLALDRLAIHYRMKPPGLSADPFN